MIRSVVFITLAIRSVAPWMSESKAEGYAKILHVEARARHFDPVTVVAMVENESRWHADVIGGSNKACYGLGQKCAHAVALCRQHGYQSAKCKAEMTPYLNGAVALREIARSITEWRKLCRKITGKPALFARWLYGYQGHAVKNPRAKCGMVKTRKGWVDVPRPRLVRKVMQRRLEIIRATRKLMK